MQYLTASITACNSNETDVFAAHQELDSIHKIVVLRRLENYCIGIVSFNTKIFKKPLE
ncbi:MAG: hypothetical protein WCA84_10600 [Ignavibacteriaceae bacterium]